MLLSLARSIFEEQNNLDCLVSKIMTQARDLIKCERCVVFLLDLECEEAVRTFWQHISFLLLFSIFTFLFFLLCCRAIWNTLEPSQGTILWKKNRLPKM